MGAIYNVFELLGRILISVMFLQSGIGKIGSYAHTGQYMTAKAVPSLLLPLVIILEVAGSIAVILGWKTRLSAFLMAGFCILAALLFHWNFADQMQSINFMKNISIAGGFLVIFAHGAGVLSLDGRRRKSRGR